MTDMLVGEVDIFPMVMSGGAVGRSRFLSVKYILLDRRH
jgi:hypothetical protein